MTTNRASGGQRRRTKHRQQLGVEHGKRSSVVVKVVKEEKERDDADPFRAGSPCGFEPRELVLAKK